MRPLTLLISLTVLNHSAFTGTRVAVALYAIHLGASPFTVGMLMALYALLPMFFSVSIGRLIDRVGVRVPMLVASLMLAASALIPYLWQTLEALYFASTLIGSSFMVYHVSMQSISGHMGRPEERAMNFSLVALGFSISGFSGPMIAGFCIDHFGYPLTFLTLAFFPLIPAAVFAANKVRLPRTPGHGMPRDPNRRLMDLVRHTELRRVFIVSSLTAIAWDLFAFAMPIYGSSIGLSASSIGLVMGSFALATFVIRVFLPVMSRRLAPWSVLIASLTISATTFFLFPLLQSPASLMALAFVLGLGIGMSQPMVMSLMHNASPPGRVGEAVGLRLMLMNGSQTSMPLLFGAVGSVLGMAPVFWVTAVVLYGGAYAARRYRAVR